MSADPLRPGGRKARARMTAQEFASSSSFERTTGYQAERTFGGSAQAGRGSPVGSRRSDDGSGDDGPGGGYSDDGAALDEGPGGGRGESGDLVPSGGSGGGGGRDPADLINFLTSRWMKLTVIAQPDLRGLLTHPALRNIIAAIASEALAEVMKQMQKNMEFQVNKQMDEQLSRLAKKRAAYSLSELTTMSPAQIGQYNTFAPAIKAPLIEGDEDDDTGSAGAQGP
ncbi:hypothetical protein B0H12DRAFT_1245618 [Mycena haematopus]|nr:hypothetical protein B0H12DRAFT_1245618 [Mycena haematopus]